MRNRWLFLAVATLIIFAVVGLIILSGMRQRNAMEQSKTDAAKTNTTDVAAAEDKPIYSSLGKSIYYAAIGTDGRDILYTGGPHWMGTMNEKGCVNCHGIDGRGGFTLMMTSIVAPDTTYDALTSEEHYHGGQREVHEGRYTDEAIKQAITEGTDPSGRELSHVMPRWKMTDVELNELLVYLKNL